MEHLEKVQGKRIRSISFRDFHGLCIFLKGGDVLEIIIPEYSECRTVDKVREKHGSRLVNVFINLENEDFEDRNGDCWEIYTVQILTTRGSLTWTVMCGIGDEISTTYHKGGLNASH